ncbi:MAG TPA: hypothetical protein PK707_00750 [Candidatus Syntrophosphaera thermopropionivorans]|nr:hypothetical protein [Candidatus Syntrophosphaera thermopropionivorans]HOL32909.1 hypothetical protein [Candidatus Syntrophosphaera thermopropionivorans]HOR29830.1 hypothetical protein [Candidatus Syntrophosphaera thermopropionivorans]HPW25053.1 hypothetical protein [Candidatus Syntrophosphaera thermopropionivorans]HQC58199.1 hypothetical protein [Candidatus Syntrophosphaera thermopropionivorans]
MKKRLFFGFLLIGMALTLTSCFVHSSLMYFEKDTEGLPNLLSNPGFNAYSLDPRESLKGWSVLIEPADQEQTPPNIVFIDGERALHGSSSLRIDASPYKVSIISDPFKVNRYGGYYVRCYTCSSEPKGPQINLRMLTFKADGSIDKKFKDNIQSKNEWDKMSISAGFLSPGVSFGRVIIEIPPFTQGSVWLDDAGCWEVHHFKID